MHLCSGIDTGFDDFGKVIFKPAHIPNPIEPTDSENCPVCRQMRAVGAMQDDAATSFRVQLMLNQLINAPMQQIGIYPHHKARWRRSPGLD